METGLTDQHKRKRLCKLVLKKVEGRRRLLQKTSHDGMPCSLVREVNKQNFRYWETENPDNASIELVPRTVFKVTMWVVVGWYGIIDSNFFEDDQG